MNRPEQQLQRSVVEYLHLAQPRCLWFAYPAQRGTRKRYEMGILKAMGVKPGVADLLFLWKDGCACIELKAPGGKLSKAQCAFWRECDDLGVKYFVCFSLEQVISRLDTWRIPMANDVRLS